MRSVEGELKLKYYQAASLKINTRFGIFAAYVFGDPLPSPGTGRTRWEWVLRGTDKLKPCLWVE